MVRLLLGDDTAAAGEARVVMYRASRVHGVARTVFGGVLLEDLTDSRHWVMADGSLVFVPRRWFQMVKKCGMKGTRIDQLMICLGDDNEIGMNIWESKV